MQAAYLSCTFHSQHKHASFKLPPLYSRVKKQETDFYQSYSPAGPGILLDPTVVTDCRYPVRTVVERTTATYTYRSCYQKVYKTGTTLHLMINVCEMEIVDREVKNVKHELKTFHYDDATAATGQNCTHEIHLQLHIKEKYTPNAPFSS